MFTNAILYRIAPSWVRPDLDSLEPNLCGGRFAPCGASQERSAGWVEPRGEDHGTYLESVGGQWVLRYMIEAKGVPGAVIRRKLAEKVAQVELATGRKPGKKESRELKEDVVLKLLPMAFAKQTAIDVWIDPANRLLVVATASQGRADEIVTALVQAIPGFALSLLNTVTSPTAAMAEWLVSQEPPAGFSVDRECELVAADESKAVIKYGRHPLDIDEVRNHISQGKLPTKLAMTWDERVSFVLTNGLVLKKIKFLEGVFDGASGQKEDGFDADVAIATGELQKLIVDLLEALDGEVQAVDSNSDLF